MDIKGLIIETTNQCNANCIFCPRKLMTRKIKTMTLDEFKIISKKITRTNLKIKAMYSFGEPLLDDTLFEKYDYANRINILDNAVSLNTNGSLLLPELYDKILKYSKQITISCFNVGKGYEKLTNLNWDQTYKNIKDFIKYRDENYPSFKIIIGINSVQGYDEIKVKKAFKEYNVIFNIDYGIEWKDKIEGAKNCDLENGIITIRSNGDCSICCFDYNSENILGNIFKDSIKELNFKLNRTQFPICNRCDYIK